MPWQWKRMVKPDGHACYRAVNTCEQCQREFISEQPGSAKYCPECGIEKPGAHSYLEY